MFLRLADLGFSLDDFATNGFFLPSTEMVAVDNRLPLHRGGHRSYNDIVIASIERIRHRTTASKSSPAKTLFAIRQLQKEVGHSLAVAALDEPIVLLSGRNPFGTDASLDALDRKTDALFDALGNR